MLFVLFFLFILLNVAYGQGQQPAACQGQCIYQTALNGPFLYTETCQSVPGTIIVVTNLTVVSPDGTLFTLSLLDANNQTTSNFQSYEFEEVETRFRVNNFQLPGRFFYFFRTTSFGLQVECDTYPCSFWFRVSAFCSQYTDHFWFIDPSNGTCNSNCKNQDKIVCRELGFGYFYGPIVADNFCDPLFKPIGQYGFCSTGDCPLNSATSSSICYCVGYQGVNGVESEISYYSYDPCPNGCTFNSCIALSPNSFPAVDGNPQFGSLSITCDEKVTSTDTSASSIVFDNMSFFSLFFSVYSIFFLFY